MVQTFEQLESNALTTTWSRGVVHGALFQTSIPFISGGGLETPNTEYD